MVRGTAVLANAAVVLKIVRSFLVPLAYADSSSRFHSPWTLDASIDSPVFWDSKENLCL
jgi:hypothetical protein